MIILLFLSSLIWWTTTTIDGCHIFDKLRLSNLVRTIDVASWNVVIETVLQSKFDWQQTIPHTWDARAHAHNYEQRNPTKTEMNRKQNKHVETILPCLLSHERHLHLRSTINLYYKSTEDILRRLPTVRQFQAFVCLDKWHRKTVVAFGNTSH